VFNLQGEDTSKPAGNWFQLSVVLFTKEYLLVKIKILGCTVIYLYYVL